MDILVIGILAAVLQVVLAAAFLWRKQTPRFPFFFAYTLFSILAIVMDVALRSHYISYLSELVYGILALLAMREAYRHALDDLYIRHHWSRMAPPVLLIVAVLFPLWRCFHHLPTTGIPFEACLYSAQDAFQLCVAAIEVLLLGTYLYLTWAKQYRWRRYNQAILVGFGTYGLMSLLAVALHAMLHVPFESWVRYLSPGAYFVATVLWLLAFLSDADRPRSKQPTDERRLDRMDATLQEYLRDLRGKNDE